jgi:hypothetical protein
VCVFNQDHCSEADWEDKFKSVGNGSATASTTSYHELDFDRHH